MGRLCRRDAGVTNRFPEVCVSRWQNVLFVCGLVWMAMTQSAPAQDQPQLSGDEWLTLRIGQSLQYGRSLKAATDNLVRTFHNADIDGGGVSERDYQLKEEMDAANRRASFLRQEFDKDLNGDGQVSRQELETVLGWRARRVVRRNGTEIELNEEQIAQITAAKMREALAADTDKNGIITFPEALAAAAAKPHRRSGRLEVDRPISLLLDENGDGRVSASEFKAAIARVVHSIDTDGDGQVSGPEKSIFDETYKNLRRRSDEWRRKQRMIARTREIAASCHFPAAPEGAEIAVVGTYNGRALSTVGLGGDDAVVTVADVQVEPGDKSIYVLLTSYEAMIWRFSGAIDRVTQVVANSTKKDADGNVRVGVAGVPSERISFSSRPGCLRYFTGPASDRKTAAAIEMIPFLVGRAADHVAGANRTASVRLPGGDFTEAYPYAGSVVLPNAGAGRPLWREMMRFYPGGLVATDVRSVVSGTPVKPYEVLPQSAGLAQLLDAGALEVAATSAVVLTNGMRIFTGGGRDTVILPKDANAEVIELPTKLAIVKKIKFPAGLSGGHAVTFVLKPGVPEPEGSPGHSKIER